MGKIEFIKPGLYTSLQDQGRISGRNWGIPQGGAMDRWSARRANLLLNNDLRSSVLEITGIGPTLRCHGTGQMATAGARITVFQNDRRLDDQSLINFSDKDILKFGNTSSGFRTYLGIKNGFIGKELFGSISPIANISSSLRFEKGDTLDFSDSLVPIVTKARVKNPLLFQDKPIETIPGPEYDLLSEAQQQLLKNTQFTISPTASRMACSLLPNIKILEHSTSILTGPVVPGTIQLTPDGQLIILMRDAQTTGGYPRILVVSEAGINQLGQMRGGMVVDLLSRSAC